jgi:hypothetical protein
MPRPTLLALVFMLAAAPTLALAEYQLEIGPDTTVIDGPLNPDCTINYLAYLNKKLSEGVTPENNFAVDVALVMSVESWQTAALREKTLKDLGVFPPPTDHPVLVKFATFLDKQVDDFTEDPDWQTAADATTRPWSADEYPKVKKWLDSQGEVLDHISRTIPKTKFAMPLNIKEGELQALDNIPLPWLGTFRSLARLYTCRAQFRVGTGDISGAWEDVRDAHKMACLLENEPASLSWLVAESVHEMAWQVVESIASSEHLTSKQAKTMLADLQSLRPFSSFVDTYDLQVRMSMLDTVCRCANGQKVDFVLSEAVCSMMASDQFDLNAALRMSNLWIDRFVAASGQGDFSARDAALHATADSLEEQVRLALQLYGEDDEEAVRLLGPQIAESNKYTVATMYRVVYLMRASPENLHHYQAEEDNRGELLPAVLAIGGYHAEHGEFPPNLNALVPEYLDSLPTDFATGEPPVYRVEDGAAIVYSLGTNLKDDDGVDDQQDGDIVFRIER